MALFQKSVLNKYLKGLDETLIKTQYEAFKNYFLNPEIQDNIRESKEEQFQATFLNELFVKVLGYTLNPNPNYNLTTEYKNVKDAKKADGAILQDGKAIGVIELKGMNTTNLDKVEKQAFGYKNNQPDAVYVVTSNFEKIRFYVDNAVDFEEFNLFHLSLERFKILYLCLAKDNIFINLPKQIKDSSLEEEQNVTKKLYKDYSSFKQQLFQSIVELNPEHDKLILFKKTQKLLDRFLFIFFAEDGGLLPPNSIRSIIEQWVQLRDELDAYTPLYNRFKKYFGYMNTGHKGKKHDIFAYNGGLFAPDDILDNIKIDDTILYISTQQLSGYDFKSEVDVNILGHIFEHSLNEIENVTAELAGQTVDKSKTKRKKDGVFYTPKYITKYIVENTVGKLCEERKTALNIDETEYNKSRKGRKKATLKKLKQQLDDYRNWLLNITICDPACGSGAFLNQALDFLIEEHTYIDELETKLLGGSFVFPNIENAILENNLYGVDINEESVDIAKLSLWLRSAKPNRKLNSLNSNIKCGNSLIDDPKVAGDKAFHWQTAFPKVFRPIEKEAFHIVLTTHNSRTSQRMIKYNVQKGEPVELALDDEILLTTIFKEVLETYNYQCLAYNVCKDHVHLILVCEFKNLHDIVRTIKSNVSRKFNIAKGKTTSSKNNPTGLAPLPQKTLEKIPPQRTLEDSTGQAPLDKTSTRGETQNHLWSQKFFYANLDVWELATPSKRIGYAYDDQYIDNAMNYIENNRNKHELPQSDELEQLIDSFTTSIDAAFELEYDGGFDVVIGNPPYVGIKGNNLYLKTRYKTYKSKDLYALFYEKGINLLSNNGKLGFITPSSFMTNIGFYSLRLYLIDYSINSILDLGENIFSDASVDSAIIIITKSKKNDNPVLVSNNLYDSNTIQKNVFRSLKDIVFNIYINPSSLNFCNKISKENSTFNEYVKFARGVEFGFRSEKVISEKINNNYLSIVCGGDISRYSINAQNKFLLFDDKDTSIYKNISIYKDEKILVRRIGNSIISCFDETGLCNVCDVYNLQIKKTNNYNLKEIQAILNSKLIDFFYTTKFKSVKKLFPKIPIQNLKLIPIPKYTDDIHRIDTLIIDKIIRKNREKIKKQNRFLKRLTDNLNIEKPSKKLQSFYDYDFKTFVKELKKKKVKLSLTEQDEWEDYFNAYTDEIKALQTEINRIDKEIDKMVYELYGLTEEEIAIVENS